MADNTAAEETEQQITFTVKSSSESKYVLTLPLSTTVGDLKQTLSAPDHANIPPERQRLIYSGRVLKDPDTIGACKIKDGNTVHLVKGAESNSRQNPANQGGAASTTTPAGGAAAGSAPANNVPTSFATGTGASNPLAQLTGARYAGLHGLPGMDAFGADGGMGAPPSPDQMLRLLEDPAFASQMNEAMNNPAVLDMLRNNPMIRNNPMARQAIENPEFRRMMMNPDMIRMQMQMQRAMEGMGGGAGGGAGAGGFPMPGQTDTTEPAPGDAPANPTNPVGGANPTANTGANPAAANPFAALFPGAAAGATGQQQTGAQNQNNPLAAMTQHFMQNPEAMQQMMGMLGMGGAGNNAAMGTGETGAAGANPFGGGLNPFMFGDFGGQQATAAPQSPPDNRPPEERYEEQLRQLNDMGFFEFERNVQALRRSGGSVQGAVEYLLTNP